MAAPKGFPVLPSFRKKFELVLMALFGQQNTERPSFSPRPCEQFELILSRLDASLRTALERFQEGRLMAPETLLRRRLAAVGREVETSVHPGRVV